MRYTAFLILATCGMEDGHHDVHTLAQLTPMDEAHAEVAEVQRAVDETRLDAAELLAAVRAAHPEITRERRAQ